MKEETTEHELRHLDDGTLSAKLTSGDLKEAQMFADKYNCFVVEIKRKRIYK